MNNTMKSALAALVLSSMGCGPGAIKDLAGQPEVPPTPGAHQCKPGDIGKKLTPLVIDWPSTQRGDLEAAMAENRLAVVKFSCEGVEVLTDCELPGQYGYKGISPKQENTLIEGGDDISANFGGVNFGADVDFSQNAKLDLATVTVGKRKTVRKALTRAELGEYCEGATHFVRYADIGAFAMSTGSNIQAGAALQVFGQGISGSSRSKEAKSKKDGDPTSCKNAARKDADSPNGCSALIRVQLTPIVDGESLKAANDAVRRQVDDGVIDCPADSVFSDGQCIARSKISSATHYLCEEGDEAGCLAQCKKGSNASCGRLGMIYGQRMDEADGPEGVDFTALASLHGRLKDACDEDYPAACYTYAGVVVQDAMRNASEFGDKPPSEWPKKVMMRVREGVEYLEYACIAGGANACDILKSLYLNDSGGFAEAMFGEGVDTKAKYVDLLDRACGSASGGACKELFELVNKGEAQISGEAVVRAGTGACEGGFDVACISVAVFVQESVGACVAAFDGVPALQDLCTDEVLDQFAGDAKAAAYMLRRGCQMNEEMAATAMCKRVL